MHTEPATENRILPFAVEAAWATRRWEALQKFSRQFHGNIMEDFNISIAAVFESLHKTQGAEITTGIIRNIREKIASSMTFSATSSLEACHDLLLKCHVLTDLEIISDVNEDSPQDTLSLLDRRLEVLGAYVNDKQYLLGIRRAAMELMRYAHFFLFCN
jgi:serine/threonine-protein kinase ATR